MNRRGKYARLPLLVAVLLLLALIPFALFRGSQAPEAEAAWWDNSWRYRKSIQVTNNTSQQSNVYISLTLDTSDTTKFQDDCGDLRFTKQNGQLLPYYIVSGCGTVSTGVHVQLDTFPAGAQTLYAYYGNPSAPNAFANNNFLMEATNYSVGGTGSEETAPGPVAYWKFDEGSGSTAHDSAGDNHGMVNGATWAGEGQCVNSDCLSFTNGPYVSTSPNSLANAQQAFSVSVWIKPQLETPTGSDRYGYIVTKGSLFGGGGFKLYQQENQQIGFYAGWSSGYTPEREIRTTFEDVDKWYQVVAVFNGESQSLYIDGELKAQNSVPNRFLGNTEPIAIGGWSNNYRPFHGLIDEVKIFPYALTEDEIKAEYNLGVAAVIGTGPAAPPPVGGNLDDSLVAHWAFDEQYGQTAHDKVGNNHGTFGADTNSGNDDPTWKPAGECKVNGCLGFDGSNDYLPLGSDPSLDLDNMTISAWVYPTSDIGWYTVFQRADGNPNGYRLKISNSKKWAFSGGVSGTFALSDVDVTTNTWTHVAGSWNGADNKIYVNGRLAGSFSESGALPTTAGEIARIGSYNGISQMFPGLIDEVKIYNAALTPEQVLQDMNAGASLTVGMGANEADEIIDGAGAPPIAEWKFDEKQGTTAYDTSGNGNDGTVNGATWKSGCQQGACLEFDGVDDYLGFDNTSSEFNPDTSISVSFWVKVENDALAWQRLLYKGSDYSNGLSPGWQFRYQAGTLYFYLSNGISTRQQITTTVAAQEWHHITGVIDQDLGKMRLYQNGSLVNELDIAAYIEGIDFGTTEDFLIGKSDIVSGGLFSGQIDHVKIYDYARTPAQIAYDYNRGAPIAHWKFDECEGTVAHDASGNENHGMINIGATGAQTTAGTCSTSGAWANGASGKFSGSLNFDGIDDYVELDSARLSFERTSPFSIGLWMKPAALTTNTIFSKQLASSPYTGYALWLLSNGSVKFEMFNSTGSTMHSSAGTLVTGKWQHILITYDGSGSSADVNIYINGNPESTSDSGSISGSITNSVAPQIMGREGPNRVSSGQIDDVRVYNYVLSPAQVRKVMNEGVALRFGPAN